MDWYYPNALFLALPALAFLFWINARSCHPMGERRRRFLFFARSALVLLAILALASPARLVSTREQAVMFVLDHSRSQGTKGIETVYEVASQVSGNLIGGTSKGFVASGSDALLLTHPGERRLPKS